MSPTMTFEYLPGDIPPIDPAKPQLVHDPRMLVTIMTTGKFDEVGGDIHVHGIVLAGRNSKYPIGTYSENWILSSLRKFQHKLTLKND